MTNKTKETAEKMAKLFDDILIGQNLDTDSASDYSTQTTTTVSRDFNTRCEDIKVIMKSDNVKPNTENSEDIDKVLSKSEEVQEKKEVKSKTKKASVENPQVNETPIVKEVTQKSESIVDVSTFFDEDTLTAVKAIQAKYPFFSFNSNNKTFVSFYKDKIRVLKNLLASYPLLNLNDMRQELDAVDLQHQIGTDVASPDLIRQKIDRCYMWRTRVAVLLSRCLQQYPSWKRTSEMLCAKLCRDHNIKGVHKRQSLDLEHMSDVLHYVEGLKGFIDSATLIDGILKSANDSLSRQLSCVMTRQEMGIGESKFPFKQDEEVTSVMDELDSIDPGTVIKTKKQNHVLIANDFGVSFKNKEDEELFG